MSLFFSCCVCCVSSVPLLNGTRLLQAKRYMGCQSKLASQTLCLVGYDLQGGSWGIPFSLYSGLFYKCSLTCLPITGFQPHLDAAPQHAQALADTIASCLSHSYCLVCPPSSLCCCHRGLVKQQSCGHQIIVRASCHQLRPRQALPNAEHCPTSQLLPFNYNVAEILFIGLHLTLKTYIETVSTFCPDHVDI